MHSQLGIDPGAKYVGVCLLSPAGEVIDATTFARNDRENRAQWVEHVMSGLDRFLAPRGTVAVAVEDVVAPKTYLSGKRASYPLGDGYLFDTCVILGAVVGGFEKVCVVSPGSNGSRGDYPSVLVGRPSAALTRSEHPKRARNHEQSAYDVARLARSAR